MTTPKQQLMAEVAAIVDDLGGAELLQTRQLGRAVDARDELCYRLRKKGLTWERIGRIVDRHYSTVFVAVGRHLDRHGIDDPELAKSLAGYRRNADRRVSAR